MLKYLYLANNKIEFIEKNAFNGLNSLQLIDLSNNSLTKINSDVLTGIPALVDLYLNDNLFGSDFESLN